MKSVPEKNVFDRSAAEYENILRGMVGRFDGDLDYFASYKIQILKRVLVRAPKRVLDFGTGVGRSLPHLRAAFPQADLCGFDPSAESLAHAARVCPEARLETEFTKAGDGYDLILLAGVLHHLPESEVDGWLALLKVACSPRGTIAIFEHNLKNPITKRLVTESEYDRGARFYNPQETKSLLERAGFKNLKSEYTLFFPAALKPLRPFEKYLGRFPLGGQFWVTGESP